jgi:Bacterial Ig-like domain (group 3)
MDDTTTLTTVTLDASAIATSTTSQLSGGTHTFTASYSGDSAFAVTQSVPLSVTVTAIPTTVAITGTTYITAG